MLKSTMSDSRILQPSAITIVPSVADVFFDLARNLNDCPTTFTFIRDKVPDPNFRLILNVICEFTQFGIEFHLFNA